MASDSFWRDMSRPIQAGLRALKDETEAMDSVSRKEYRKQAIKHLENSTEQLEQAAKNKLFVAELEVVKASIAQLKGEANADSVAKDAAQKLDASDAARAEQKAGQVKREEIFRDITGAPQPPPKPPSEFDEKAARETPYTWDQDEEGTVTVSISVPPECKKGDVSVSFSRQHLKVLVKGHPLQPVLDHDLLYEIVSSDSSWGLEGSGAKRKLVVAMEKSAEGLRWEGLVDSEEGRMKKTITGMAEGMGFEGMKKWGEE